VKLIGVFVTREDAEAAHGAWLISRGFASCPTAFRSTDRLAGRVRLSLAKNEARRAAYAALGIVSLNGMTDVPPSP
jgi:hypothetical protein